MLKSWCCRGISNHGLLKFLLLFARDNRFQIRERLDPPELGSVYQRFIFILLVMLQMPAMELKYSHWFCNNDDGSSDYWQVLKLHW